MRVGVITNGLPPVDGGGAERYAADLSAELAARGHSVLVLSGSSGSVPGARVAPLSGRPEVDMSGSAAVKLRWHLADQWRASVHREVHAALSEFRPDVVHSHNVQRITAAAFTGIAAARVPHVHTAHDFNVICMRVSLTRNGRYCGGHCLSCQPQRIIRRGAIRRRLDRLIAPSDYVRRRHVEFGVISEERSLTIRQGAAPAPTRLRQARTPLSVGFIGSLLEAKGVLTLLEAHRMQAEPRWTLTLAGAGPLQETVAAAAGAQPGVRYLGRVDGHERERFFDSIDVLAAPSQWEENAPLVVAEAQIRGLPCVVSDRGGLAELPHAVIVPSRDPRALAEALDALAAGERLQQLSAALIGHADEVSWARHVERVEEVLRRAAGGGHA